MWFWRNFRHWLHRKLSKRQLPVQLATKTSSKSHCRSVWSFRLSTKTCHNTKWTCYKIKFLLYSVQFRSDMYYRSELIHVINWLLLFIIVIADDLAPFGASISADTVMVKFGPWKLSLKDMGEIDSLKCNKIMMTSSNGNRVTGRSDVSLICALNKRLSKQSWGWWFETPSRSLWRHCNAIF